MPTLLLLLAGTVNAQEACTAQEVAADLDGQLCAFGFDGTCDAGIDCPERTDCFDCDPCAQYIGDCQGCVANGCLYCPDGISGTAFCLSPAVAEGYASECFIDSPGFIDSCPSCNYPAQGSDSPEPLELCELAYDKTCNEVFDETLFDSVFGDQGPFICGVGTDCFDCDPCHQWDYTSCGECVANGCAWCGYVTIIFVSLVHDYSMTDAFISLFLFLYP